MSAKLLVCKFNIDEKDNASSLRSIHLKSELVEEEKFREVIPFIRQGCATIEVIVSQSKDQISNYTLLRDEVKAVIIKDEAGQISDRYIECTYRQILNKY